MEGCQSLFAAPAGEEGGRKATGKDEGEEKGAGGRAAGREPCCTDEMKGKQIPMRLSGRGKQRQARPRAGPTEWGGRGLECEHLLPIMQSH